MVRDQDERDIRDWPVPYRGRLPRKYREGWSNFSRSADMNPFANAPRYPAGAWAARGLAALRYAIAAALLSISHPAAALYAEVKPTVKVGVDCIAPVSLLAPKLRTCAIAAAKARIWCPNGQVFEGVLEHGGPASALARSLCNMSQVP